MSRFAYDVFLSHSSRDTRIVREIAEQLQEASLRVWFDEWMLRPGDSIWAKIEDGLEQSRVLVLCMSAYAFGSDWAQLESGTFRFRDPLNKARRLIPLRLDDTPARGSLAQLVAIDWHAGIREHARAQLVDACRPPRASIDDDPQLGKVQHRPLSDSHLNSSIVHCRHVLKGHTDTVRALKLTPDGKHLVSGSQDGFLRLWNLASGRCEQVFAINSGIREIVVDSHNLIYAGCENGTIAVCDLKESTPKAILEGHDEAVYGLTLTFDEKTLVSGSVDTTVRIWDLHAMTSIRTLNYRRAWVNAVVIKPDGTIIIGTEDGAISAWEEGSSGWHLLDRHSLWVWGLALSSDGSTLVSGSGDSSVGIWNARDARRIAFLEGHRDKVSKVAISFDGVWAVSGSLDRTARIWSLATGELATSLEGHSDSVECVSISSDGHVVVTGSVDQDVRVWTFTPEQTQVADGGATRYTNAKVLLVGESGAGKTGLSQRLVTDTWSPSSSTVGAKVDKWELPASFDDNVEGEIWLWDFGGQADQRLVHQLYMDDTALAVLVFDGQRDDFLESLAQWDHDIGRGAGADFVKLLVAGRIDAGGVRGNTDDVESFKNRHGYAAFIETSANTGLGCTELRQAIIENIRWGQIPWRSSPPLFKRLKEEIVGLRDAGRVLMRFNELREALLLRLTGEFARFTDEELAAVVRLLGGPGVVWDLNFGSWILLQPERINNYAQAMIQTIRADVDERGCIAEERVLGGDLRFHQPEERLQQDDERFVLFAMHKLLLERGLCLREHTETGTMLIFPSYYRRERTELTEYPAPWISYQFEGFLDDVYATLIVRLHHSTAFVQRALWRDAADFATLAGQRLGVRLERRARGTGELVVYADHDTGEADKIVFGRYVLDHLLAKASGIKRLRHYVCTTCGTPVGNADVAVERLEAWLANTSSEQNGTAAPKQPLPSIVCARCENRVALWDGIERYFSSSDVERRVRHLQRGSDLVLARQSKHREIVGEVISTVSLAGQVVLEFSVPHHGLDLQIEILDDDGSRTSHRVLVALRSLDAELRPREPVLLKTNTHDTAYWMTQDASVVVVIGDVNGQLRWMNVGSYLRQLDGDQPVAQVTFTGERLDVMSVRRWRDMLMACGTLP